MTILEEAGHLVDGPREAHYGHPADDFGSVTRAAYELGIDPVGFSGDARNRALHHALYMVLVKIQRLVQTPGHYDSIVDIAGYARTYEKVWERHEGKDQVPEVREGDSFKGGSISHGNPGDTM